jgi:hypothetical protein
MKKHKTQPNNMPRRRKSLEELIWDLVQIKSSYEHLNYDLNEMKKQFFDFNNAKSFIKRNKDLDSNHPTILEKKTDNESK